MSNHKSNEGTTSSSRELELFFELRVAHQVK